MKKRIICALAVVLATILLAACGKTQFDYNYNSGTLKFAYDSTEWETSTPVQEGGNARVLNVIGKKNDSRMEIYYGKTLDYAGDMKSFVNLQKSNDRMSGEMIHSERKASKTVNGKRHDVWQYKLADGTLKRIVFIHCKDGEIIIGEVIKNDQIDYKTIEHSIDFSDKSGLTL